MAQPPKHPFPETDDASPRVADWGEKRLLAGIREWLGPVTPEAPAGMGDDCAVLPALCEGHQLLTTDTVTHGQHFDASVAAADAGAKLVKRNLSDIAAMGGEPGPALLSLICGPDLSLPWLEDFFSGVWRTCAAYSVTIAGGDVSEAEAGRFSAVLWLTGRSAHPVLRRTATPGDTLYVTGELGGSLLGKHYCFTPRLAEGAWLAARGACSAMIDLSDGPAKDLPELLPGGAVALIDRTAVPVAESARELARRTGRSAESHAFCDGEDHELLFTVPTAIDQRKLADDWSRTFPEVPLHRIGEIRQGGGAAPLVDAATGNPLPWTGGFEHWSKRP